LEETVWAARVRPPAPSVTHIHLVDLDQAALTRGAGALRDAAVQAVTVACVPAEQATLAPSYDVALFLSLFHHYDRLGGAFRTAGLRLLSAVMQRTQLLLFETGQNDDTQANAEEWRGSLMMAECDALTWLTETLPGMLGVAGVRHLGTNPMTGRHLMAYWHRVDLPRSLRELHVVPSDAWQHRVVGDVHDTWPTPDARRRLATELAALRIEDAPVVVRHAWMARQASHHGAPMWALPSEVDSRVIGLALAEAELLGVVGVLADDARVAAAARCVAPSALHILQRAS
jgi:hypothetical protein